MSELCACICGCADIRAPDCSDLCAECWRAWCVADPKHAPVADSSYMGTYGITGVWAGWLISRGAGHLMAEPAGFFQRAEIAPTCPIHQCSYRMVRRPGAWKCYRHGAEPVTIPVPERFPRSPQMRVLPGKAT